MAKGSLKKTQLQYKSDQIVKTPVSEEQVISFNFKNLRQTEKFTYANQEPNYFIKVLERIQEISKMTKKEANTRFKRILHCHEIDFLDRRVSEDTFGINDEADLYAYQFAITVNAHGRVHGYFIENIFYVVWLDPHHLLFPDNR